MFEDSPLDLAHSQTGTGGHRVACDAIRRLVPAVIAGARRFLSHLQSLVVVDQLPSDFDTRTAGFNRVETFTSIGVTRPDNRRVVRVWWRRLALTSDGVEPTRAHIDQTLGYYNWFLVDILVT